MKYAFFGSPRFADIILKKLIDAGMPPVVLVCNPDRPIGRKQIITSPPTKILAQHHNIKIYQPEKLNEEDARKELSEIDLAVVAAYAKIIPQEIVQLPKLGMLGVHPSLLPKYRGTTPIQTAILDGVLETGVTLYALDEKVDHGPVIAQRQLDNELRIMNYVQAEEKLAELGGDLLIEILPKFSNGETSPHKQNEDEATFTKKFKTEDGFVELDELEKAQSYSGDEAIQLDRKIRALAHEPGVWTLNQDGKRMKLLEATLSPEKKLILKKTQIEGKREQEI